MPSIRASLTAALFVLVCGAAVLDTAQAQTAPTADDKPITIYADVVQGWSEEFHHALYAKGNVSIERGTTRIKMKDAILWVTKPTNDAPEVRAILYGEGAISLEENSKPKRSLERISLQWKTTGELRVIAPSKPSGQPEATDPFYQRARAVLLMPPEVDKLTTDSAAVTAPPVLSPPAPAPDQEKPSAAKLTRQTTKQNTRAVTQDPTTQPADASNVFNRSNALGISSRSSSPYQYRILPGKPGEYTAMIWGGITLYSADENSVVDISADRAVIWAKGVNNTPGQGIPNFSNFRKDQIEVYLEGHVEIRYRHLQGTTNGIEQLVLADRGYYDVGRNVALMSKCELIYRLPGMPLPIHVQAAEVRQLDLNNFQANEAVFFASRLPSDPDLKVMAGTMHIELRDVPQKGFFDTTAFDPVTSGGAKDAQIFGDAENVQFRFMDFTFASLSHVHGDLRDPLGPLEGIRFKADGIFGVGMAVQFDALELFGFDKPTNTSWSLSPLFYSKRGPGVTSEYSSNGVGLFGFPGRYDTFIRGQFQYDYADYDTLANDRKPAVPDPFRGLLTLRHRQELSENWSVQAEVGYQSDRNFYEQWWKRTYDEDLLQATYLQFKYQNEQFAFNGLLQPNIRPWVNEGAAIPRGDLWLVGQDFFNTFTYFGHASAGFYRFNTTSDLPDSYFATPYPDEFLRYRPLPPSSDMPHKQSFNLARFDYLSELDLPLHFGFMNLTPYGLADLAYYTDDMSQDGNSASRLYYGGGIRGEIPFSRLYSNVQSDFFNVRGINHKISIEGDYRYTQSNVDFRRLPLLDRLDDDTTDQARRDLRMYRIMNGVQLNLAQSPLYDPQLYALRQGYLGSPDNLDSMEYVRFGVRNRWQTKRGIEEAERIVDWMGFDIFATYFPNEGRDNYGHPFGLIDYAYRWQIGERTTFLAQGTVDPFQGGGSSFSAGILVERTDRLRFYFGYYNLSPVGTNAFLTNVTYVINPKYAVTWASSYDFGNTQNLGQSLIVTRTGSDIQVGLGLTWSPLQNNFGATFEVYPTALGPTRHMKAIANGMQQTDSGVAPY